MKNNNCINLLIFLSAVGGMSPVHAQISVYMSAPRATGSGFTNTDIETFESLTTGIKTATFASPNYGTAVTGITGTYTGSATQPFYIGPGTDAWSFGDKYFAVGAQSGSSAAVTLQLSGTVKYFGFGWGAGDGNNRISFYKSGALQGEFSSATLQALLGNPTVTAINGSVYNSSDYRGQPSNPTVNSGENYAFVHFIAPSGVDRVDFFNIGTGSGFESDNHTIRFNAPTITGTSLVYGGEISIPEPGTLLLAGLGMVGLIARRRKA
jgi:hypothetical protein